MYTAENDPYVYEGTEVLRNLLSITDSQALENFELEMTSLRADEPLPNGRFGVAHYRNIHKHLFQDIYEWAGRYRTVRTGKGGNWFCYPENLTREMNNLFSGLKENDFLRSRLFEEFVPSVAEFISELNAFHPFREGNGRAQLSFLSILAENAGHPLDMQRLRPTEFLAAMIDSFNGNLEPLKIEISHLQA